MGLLDLLLPKACATCSAPGRSPLCTRCERDVAWIRPPVCDRCGAPVDGNDGRGGHDGNDGTRCIECAGRDFSFRRARAVALYRGPARDALIAFKVLGDRRSARSLARPMISAAADLRAKALTFVPATRTSESSRGFNPAAELARPISAALRLPLLCLLQKIRETPDAATLGREERRLALQGAFTCEHRPPRAVVLVDDVLTTGATADACARALLEAGAKSVDIVVFARSAGGRPKEGPKEGPKEV